MLRHVPREANFPEHPLMPVHVPKANQLATEGTKKSQSIVVNQPMPVNQPPPSHLLDRAHINQPIPLDR